LLIFRRKCVAVMKMIGFDKGGGVQYCQI